MVLPCETAQTSLVPRGARETARGSSPPGGGHKLAKEMGYAPDPVLSRLASERFRPVKIRSALAWFNHWDKPENLRKQKEFDAYWRGALEAAGRFGNHLKEVRWNP